MVSSKPSTSTSAAARAYVGGSWSLPTGPDAQLLGLRTPAPEVLMPADLVPLLVGVT